MDVDVTTVRIGSRHLGPSGRIWTVHSTTPRGGRVVVVSHDPAGNHTMVIDLVALQRMIPLDALTDGVGTDMTSALQMDIDGRRGAGTGSRPPLVRFSRRSVPNTATISRENDSSGPPVDGSFGKR